MSRHVLVASFSFALACSTTPSADDAGIDADTADVADASEEGTGCTVMTCSGSVDLKLGQTIPSGDNCGNTCSFKPLGGGLATCGCTFQSDCYCPDAGDQ